MKTFRCPDPPQDPEPDPQPPIEPDDPIGR